MYRHDERTNSIRRIWNKAASNNILTAKTANTCSKQTNHIFLEIKPEVGVYHIVNEGYCNWYDFTREIFTILGWDAQIQIIPIKSSELKMLARRPAFSALKNKKLENLGLGMRDWKEALREYLMEEKRGR